MTISGKRLDIRSRSLWLKRHVVPKIWSIIRLLLLIGISYVILYPLLVKFSLVFMEKGDLKDLTVKWIPRHFTLDNIKLVIVFTEYWDKFFRTVGYCALFSMLQLISCTLAGCGFARFKYRGRGIVFAITIGTLIVPPHTYMIPLYIQFNDFDILWIKHLFTGEGVNLVGSPWTMAVLSMLGVGIRSGLYIYLLRQVFRSLPGELEEAAYVDGAGTFRTFFRVLLPNVIPTLLVVFLLSFVWQWNDTFYTGMLAGNMGTLAQQMSGLRTNIAYHLGGWQLVSEVYTSSLINTGTLLIISPLIILYVVFQRFFVQGVERSGLVG